MIVVWDTSLSYFAICTACVPAASEYTWSKAAPCGLKKTIAQPSSPGAADWWDSARFSGILLALGFSCSQAESQPAHQRLTPAIGSRISRSGQSSFCTKVFISIY